MMTNWQKRTTAVIELLAPWLVTATVASTRAPIDAEPTDNSSLPDAVDRP